MVGLLAIVDLSDDVGIPPSAFFLSDDLHQACAFTCRYAFWNFVEFSATSHSVPAGKKDDGTLQISYPP
jgi:hypothetical protein